MLGSLILSVEVPAVGDVSYFFIRSFMHVRCGSLTYLRRLTLLSSERLASGMCFVDRLLIW
jgi:hypothetical protein